MMSYNSFGMCFLLGITTWGHILIINADAGQIAFQETLPCHFFQPFLFEATEENKQAWVFLKGKLHLSLVVRVSAGVRAMQGVMKVRAAPGKRGGGFSNWSLPETTVLQVWRPQNRIHLQNPNMTPFPLYFSNRAMAHFFNPITHLRRFCNVNNWSGMSQLSIQYC